MIAVEEELRQKLQQSEAAKNNASKYVVVSLDLGNYLHSLMTKAVQMGKFCYL